MDAIKPGRQGRRRDYLKSIIVSGTCWLYTGTVNNRGYGTILGRGAHRYFYEALVGPIPEGLTIDHLCRVKLCVNPAHLEPVTHEENNRRKDDTFKSHCNYGHALEGDNLLICRSSRRSRGTYYRACRTCRILRKREARERSKQARALDGPE